MQNYKIQDSYFLFSKPKDRIGSLTEIKKTNNSLDDVNKPIAAVNAKSSTSALFQFIESLQAPNEWGSFLDAGTGVNSAHWCASLQTTKWVGVTGAKDYAKQIEQSLGDSLRPQDELLVGNWGDKNFLQNQSFDTVLADYLLGAIEGFAPYFQGKLFARLYPHVKKTLYVIGLDPYINAPVATEAGRIVREIGRMRDVCLLLADQSPYREFPAEWTLNSLNAAGFKITEARRFPNRYREKWVNSQLDMCVRRLPLFKDKALAKSFATTIEALRRDGLALCREENGLRYGADYVIACEV